MEKMPFRPELMRAATEASPAAASVPASIGVPAQEGTTSDWRSGLPVLTSAHITLRELRLEDAPTLFSMLTTEEVARFISPPPTTVEGFARFIEWTVREREAGNYACFGVVPAGMSTAVGLFQLRALEEGFRLGEWGFALSSGYWGTGTFAQSAKLVLDFAFDTIGIERLEARASVANGRGNGALRKIGAVQEGVLRRSFLRNGSYHDQVLWSLLAEEWRFQRIDPTALVH
jgi:[ribosomal protein S5]-alanine N-acetyltransferase